MNEKTNKRNPWKVAFWVSTIALSAIIIILLLLLKGKNNEIKNLQYEIESCRNSQKELNAFISEQKEINEDLICEIAYIHNEILQIKEESLENKKKLNRIKRENKLTKSQIYILMEKVDSLENGNVVDSIEIDTTVFENDSVNLGTELLNLNLEIVKTNFNSKTEEIGLDTISINHNLTLTNGGISMDNLSLVISEYVSTEGDSLQITLNTKSDGKFINIEVLRSNINSLVGDTLFRNNRDISLEAGGLPDTLEIVSDLWKHLYVEQVDQELNKKGNRKILGGLLGIAACWASYAYWVNEPDAVFFHRPDGSVTSEGLDRQNKNSLGEGISIGASAIPTYFVVNGIKDKRNSERIDSNEISLEVKITKISQ